VASVRDGNKKRKGFHRKKKGLSQQQKEEKHSNRKWFIALLVVLVVTLLSYANSVHNQFVFDDVYLIATNPHIKGIQKIPNLLGYGKRMVFYRPVRTITYALDYSLNENVWHFFGNYKGREKGLNPFGYHISNIFYHLVTSLLVFLIIGRLTGKSRVAFFAACLFALHPVHTDSVTYLSGRRDILCALFYLLGFYFFLSYRKTAHFGYIIGVFLAYLLSLGSKEMGVTLPVLFLGYDCVNTFSWNDKKVTPAFSKEIFSSLKKSIMRSPSLYVLTFLGGLSYSYYKVFIKSPSLQNAYYGESLYTTMLTVGRILVHYIHLLLFPVNLNADYTFNAFPLSSSFFEFSTFSAFILLGIIAYLAVRLLPVNKLMAFGVFWFFVTLLPVCHIFPHHELLAEHYLYLPSVGFLLVVALLCDRFMGERKYFLFVAVCFAVVMLLFSARIIDRNRDWRTRVTLYEKTVKTAPQSARVRNNLCEAYSRSGRVDEAIVECRKALAIQSPYAEAHYNLGVTLYKQGRLDEAIDEYRKAITVEPGYAKALNNLGIAYIDKGDINKAIFYLAKGLKTNQANAEVLVGFGVAFIRKGWLDRAVRQFQKALSIKPGLAVAHNNLAYCYYLKGDYQQGLKHLDEALQGGYPVPQQLRDGLEPYRSKGSHLNY
jgi:Flp pilus assembly protein TadD